MEQALEGKEFNHPLHMGQHLAYFSIILLYSTAMPSLMLLAPLYLGSHYMIEKWQLLRMCKMPPLYDIELNERAITLFTFSVAMHIVVAIWVFSTPAIFPSRVLVYQSS